MEIRQPRNKQELGQCFDLRYRIMREPWGRPRGSEQDEFESSSFHIAAFDGVKVIGTARLQKMTPKTAKIRYMAVEEGWRNKGAGKLMLRRLEDETKKWGMKRVTLNAREEAVAFYEHNGYRVLREVEKMFGSIRHFRMEKKL
jgi:N-acetylglutamate synthase-like GNAT family acetyltransferase